MDAGSIPQRFDPNSPLVDQADRAMARGDVREAASMLELAAQRGRDASTLLKLATVRRSLGDFPGAIGAAEAALELTPRNFLMAMLLGTLRELMGATHAAERAYRVACAYVPRDLSMQPGIQKKLESARRRVDAVEVWRKRLLEWQPKDVLVLTGEEERRLRQFRSNILDNLDSGPVAPPLFLFSGIKPRRYFEPGDFEGVARLAADTGAVREEFLRLAESKSADFSPRLGGLHFPENRDRLGKWSMIPLIRNGMIVEEFASRCPATMERAAALDLPKLGLISPSLYFSILEPNSRIVPHTGVTNTRLIAHFPLIVPDKCGFRVGGQTRKWEPGKPLIFDDMTVHEAWNDSDRIRVVLIADLWRPELSPAERLAITDLMDCPSVPIAD